MSAPVGAFDYDRHLCGCESWKQYRDGVREVVLRPCRPGCPTVGLYVAEAEAKGKPVLSRADTPAAGPRRRGRAK